MDTDTFRFFIYAVVIIFGLNMVLGTILEIRETNLEIERERLHANNVGNVGTKYYTDANVMGALPKSRGRNGRRLLVDPKIKDISNDSMGLNLAEITRLVCSEEMKQDRKDSLLLHSDSDKTLSKVYHELKYDNKDGDDHEGIHSKNYFSTVGHAYEPPLNSKLRDMDELNLQNKLITEQFTGIYKEDPHPGDRSWRGGGDLRHYFYGDDNIAQFKDPDVRAPPTGNEAPAMKRIYNNSSEMAPWQESIRANRVYKVDNWVYENENVMNGGNFGVLSPFDTFGSDYACV